MARDVFSSMRMPPVGAARLLSMGSVGAHAGATSEDEEIQATPIRIDPFGNLSARTPNNLPIKYISLL
eukprot:3862905-Pyramimonas_sp.AAC.1